MHQFTNPNTMQLPLHGDFLWQSAKKNFYFRNDYLKAFYLCNLLISRYPFTEEADDAKLLLHDINIENLELKRVALPGKSSFSREALPVPGGTHAPCPYYCRDSQASADKHEQCFVRHRSFFPAAAPQTAAASVYESPGAKIAIAFAVVALPIMGIARDGIVGIAVPETIALAVAGSVFWGAEKIRDIVTGYFRKEQE